MLSAIDRHGFLRAAASSNKLLHPTYTGVPPVYATERRRFLVTLPLIWQGVVSGWLFAFIVSFGELNTALFLSGPGMTTLPIEIFSYLQFQGSQLVIAAASTIQIALIVLMVAGIERIVGIGRIIRSR